MEPPFNIPPQSAEKIKPSVLKVALVSIVLFVLFFNSLFLASVGAGERGVKFNYFFGGIVEEEFTEGIHLKPPWIKVIPYNIKTQAYTMSAVAQEGVVNRDDRIQAISQDGLSVGFDVTILYHLLPEKTDEIHQTVGKKYADVIIRPISRTAIRDVAGEYVAMEMHQKRPEIAQQLHTRLEPSFREKNIILEQVLVRAIIRPKQIEAAIEDKLQAEQEAQKMDFVIQKETKEAERKKIEANGIAQANEIIGQSLTPNYLSWYWISNLDKHESVMYVPTNRQSFPLFKDIDKIKTSFNESS
ncbi:MAG: prohibitin family protein [Candidatus Altiarchaeales archaeon]|nr:prohibitin family protein [Candidatus Altiarchaeales archaeon]